MTGTHLSAPTRLPSADPQPAGSPALSETLGALLGRPARVLDLAALAPDEDRILDDVAHDAYDLVLGLRVEALVDKRGADAARRLLGELAQKAGACLVEHTPAVDGRAARASPWEALDVFAFVHELTPHETRRRDAHRPACFASNRYWYLGGQIGAFDRFQTEAYGGAHGVYDGTRRYYFGAGLAVKVHRYDHAGVGAANREVLNREVAFLRNPPPGLSVPPLVLAGETLREGWLLRGYLEGDMLLDLMHAGRRYDADVVVRDVLAELVTLEKSGLYHDDVRPWNVIVGADGHASLIDYGSVVAQPVDCAWPQDVFLSFVIFAREIHGGATALWPLIRRPWMNPDGLPEALSGACWSMLESPPETWSFARLQDDIDRGTPTPVKSGVRTILAALERFESAAEDLRLRREAAFEAALTERDAALRTRANAIAQLEGELADARGGLAGNEQALVAATAREAALDRYVAAIHRSRSWRFTAPLRFARRCLDALLRGFKPR